MLFRSVCLVQQCRMMFGEAAHRGRVSMVTQGTPAATPQRPASACPHQSSCLSLPASVFLLPYLSHSGTLPPYHSVPASLFLPQPPYLSLPVSTSVTLPQPPSLPVPASASLPHSPSFYLSLPTSAPQPLPPLPQHPCLYLYGRQGEHELIYDSLRVKQFQEEKVSVSGCPAGEACEGTVMSHERRRRC